MSVQSRVRSSAIAVATLLITSLIASWGGSPAFAATTPARTTGLHASPTSSSVKLTWSAAKNAKSYSVCLVTSKTAKNCYRTTAKSTARTVTFTGLKPTGGKDYFFKVYAWNGSVHSTSSLVGFDLLPVIKPAAVTGIKQAVTSQSVTVTWAAARNATGYVVCLRDSTTSKTCAFSSPKSLTRKATFTALPPTSGTDYFYRVYSYHGSTSVYSATMHFDLPVGAIPGFISSAHDKSSISFEWNAATSADTYVLQLATNANFTGTIKTATTYGLSYAFTSLVPGTTYYPRMQARNSGVPGAWLRARAETLPTDPFTAVVLTFNLCGQDKCVTADNKMKKWSTRKPLAGAIVRGTGADVIATQESSSKDTKFGTELPGFTLCRYYSAKSLFVRTAKYSVLRSGTITLDSKRGRYAVWCELQDKVTRTRFIASDTHLEPYKGLTRDNIRSLQTGQLLRDMVLVNPQKLPVVYAGDFNSNKANANQDSYPGGYDAPMKRFTAAGIPDSFDIADVLGYPTWNSSNQAENPPVKHSDHIDHIYIDSRIHANAWRVVISITTTDTGSVYTTPFASDHNPVLAELVIPGNN